MSLRDLPLNTKLDAESTGGKFVECIREDPERNERADEENEDAEKRKKKLGQSEVRSRVRIPT
jgi:hypothetical protein